MVDSDDVLLLRPLGCDQGLMAALQPRAAVEAAAPDGGVFTITLCPLREPATDALVLAFDQCIHPWWVGVGGDLLACWVTEPAANTFPRLPVREGEPHIAWLTTGTFDRSFALAAENCRRLTAGASLLHRVV